MLPQRVGRVAGSVEGIDVAAKILADNLASPMCSAAALQAKLAERSGQSNRTCAAGVMQRRLPWLVQLIGDGASSIAAALAMRGATSQRFAPRRSRPSPADHVKPHPSSVYEG